MTDSFSRLRPLLRDLQVEVRDASYRDDPWWRQQAREILAPSYVGLPAMFEQDVARCERAYLLRAGETLVSFFLTAFTRFPSRGTPAIFLGLSATRAEYKNSGCVRQLFHRLTSDARAFEKAAQAPAVMFGILATPSSFHAVQTIWGLPGFGWVSRDGEPTRRAA